MVRNTLVMKLGLIIIILALIAGCSSQEPTITPTKIPLAKATYTPEPANVEIPETGLLCKSDLSHIRLPDGSDFYLSAQTQITILEFLDQTIDVSLIRLLIEKGKIIIVSPLPENIMFIIESPLGSIARVDGGFTVVEYDEENKKFTTQCINGPCEVGFDPDSLNMLASNHAGVVNEEGEFIDLGEITNDDLLSGCEDNYIFVDIPATPTPDVGATATAFCGEFEVSNPGTPCP